MSETAVHLSNSGMVSPWQILFKPYGEILDIVALSNYYDKGQVPRPI